MISHCCVVLHFLFDYDMEHFIMCLWVICSSSLRKCHFTSFNFWIGLNVFFLLSFSVHFIWYLVSDTLYLNSLSERYWLNSFFHSMRSHCILVTIFIALHSVKAVRNELTFTASGMSPSPALLENYEYFLNNQKLIFHMFQHCHSCNISCVPQKHNAEKPCIIKFITALLTLSRI